MVKKGSDKKPKKAAKASPAKVLVDTEAMPAEKPMHKSLKPEKVSTEPAAKPGFRAYSVAVWQLVRNWIKHHKKLALILCVILLICILALAITAWRDSQTFTNDEMVIRVSRELGISGDANPAILDVADEQKVSQPFLEGAKNGDKVLLYYKAGKSVLFRPSDDTIVRSGTYHAPDAKVFIRQGTTDDTKVAGVKNKLKTMTGIDLVSQDASTKKDYSKIYVIDVTDRYNQQASKIAQSLSAEQIRLPQGESIPDADILVIVGNQ